MLYLIARQELRTLLRDARYWLVAAGLLALLAVSFGLARQTQRQANAERGAAQARSRTDWLRQPPRNPHKAAHFGNFAFRLKTPLSLFDNGLDAYTGTSVYLEPHKSDEFQFSSAADSPALSRFGEMTPAFALQTLLPLLLIFLFFNAVSQERENGTLRLLLAQGASLRQVALGKALGGWVAALLLLLPAFGALALLLPRQPAAPPADVWARYALLLLSYATYAAILVGLCVAVSARSARSQAALMQLLGAWLLATVLLPKLASNAGSLAYRTPSQYAYATQVQRDEHQGLNGHDPHDRRRAGLLRATLRRYHVDTVTALPVNFDAVAMVESEQYTTRVYRQRQEAVRTIFRHQNQFTTLGGLLDPVLAVQNASRALCGTDYLQFTAFQDQAETYRLYFVNAMNGYMAAHTRSGDWTTTFGPAVYGRVQPFAYQEPRLGWVLRREALGFAALLGWLAVSAALLVTLKPTAL